MSGASMAVPYVTGTVAIMLQANPELTPALVKSILQLSARSKITSLFGAVRGTG
ncbi:MAG: S8 family serine peptidase [Acidobacteriota bacterium]